VFGFARDLELALALHDQVAVQAARALARVHIDGDSPRRFRHAFLLAFAARIDERLGATSEEVRVAARSDRVRSVELVLRDRRRAVDQAVSAEFPQLGIRRVTASSGAGFASGRAAADRAALGTPSLGTRPGLPRGAR
jgi:hypothetical protein